MPLCTCTILSQASLLAPQGAPGWAPRPLRLLACVPLYTCAAPSKPRCLFGACPLAPRPVRESACVAYLACTIIRCACTWPHPMLSLACIPCQGGAPPVVPHVTHLHRHSALLHIRLPPFLLILIARLRLLPNYQATVDYKVFVSVVVRRGRTYHDGNR